MTTAIKPTYRPSPAVAAALKERADVEQVSVDEVFEKLLRQGLGLEAEIRPERRPFKVIPTNLKLKAGLDPEKVNHILYDGEPDEL